jgi:hypothetical protein
MITVSIIPAQRSSGEMAYHAIAGDKHSQGKTAGEALDALLPQLADSDTLIVVQQQRPDSYFTAEQQQRLMELMDSWRKVQERGGTLSATEQAELDRLVEAELRAAGERADEMQKRSQP